MLKLSNWLISNGFEISVDYDLNNRVLIFSKYGATFILKTKRKTNKFNYCLFYYEVINQKMDFNFFLLWDGFKNQTEIIRYMKSFIKRNENLKN